MLPSKSIIENNMNLAKRASWRAHDLKTQVGCVITDENDNVLSFGANVFPKGLSFVPDSFSDEKNDYILHAEANAIIKLISTEFTAKELRFYITHAPCKNCCKMIAGLASELNIIVKVWYKKLTNNSHPELLSEFGIFNECLGNDPILNAQDEH